MVPRQPNAGSGDEPWRAVGDMRELFLVMFAQTAFEFLQQAQKVFAKCSVLLDWTNEFNRRITVIDGEGPEAVFVRNKFFYDVLTKFHEVTKPYSDKIQAKRLDEFIISLVEAIEDQGESHVLYNLCVGHKWIKARANPGLKSSIELYMRDLVHYAGTYMLFCKCPPRMFSKVQELAMSMATQMNDGKGNFEMPSLEAVGNGVIKEIGADETEGFASQIMEDGNFDLIVDLVMSMLTENQALVDTLGTKQIANLRSQMAKGLAATSARPPSSE
jgi:hypothetical protein